MTNTSMTNTDVTDADLTSIDRTTAPTTRTTTRVTSVSVQVSDQDRAIAFYVDTLGCQLRADVEVWPGARWVEVVPPGSDVGIALLTAEGGLPIGVRIGTGDADTAHGVLTAAGATVHSDVLRLDFAPPMFTFADPDDNLLILIEDQPQG